MDEPFDARRAMLIDQARPPAGWRPVSLVAGLRAALLLDPESFTDSHAIPRVDAVMGLVKELTDRGLDGESLVRYGLAPEIVSSLIEFVMPEVFGPAIEVTAWQSHAPLVGHLPSVSTPQQPAASADAVAAWLSLLPRDLAAPQLETADNHEVFRHVLRVVESLALVMLPWIALAPLREVISLKPPTQTALNTYLEEYKPDQELMEEYRWAVERFSLTHLGEWSTSSLHLEYRWMRSQHPAPCCIDFMGDREVPSDDLKAEIAHRAAMPASATSLTAPTGMANTLSAKMQGQAVELLRQGQYREAATLFEFALSQSPDDSSAANNLGFCLLPEDPERALQHLKHAATLSYAHPLINLYNRALCHLQLNDARAALALIEMEWDQDSSPCPAGILWSPTQDGLTLTEHADVRKSLAGLAVDAAERLGRTKTLAMWKERAA